MKSSQEFLREEIHRFKGDLVQYSTRINQANELRQIDENTLRTFQTKLNELSQLLAEIRQKEINTWHLVQILRVNTSRLWHIFESTAGSTITQEVVHEDLQTLLHREQLDNDEQRSTMNTFEKQHADLLLQSQEIQLALEDFRTTILHITQTITATKDRLQRQHQTNTRTFEQTTSQVYQLAVQTKDLHEFLLHYKSLVIEIDRLLKLTFSTQTQIEMHQKSLLIYQMKLEKYKQDLTLASVHRRNYQKEIIDLGKHLRHEDENLERFQIDQTRILRRRIQLHQQIDRFEQEKIHLLNTQQQLLEQIKQTTNQTQLTGKQIFQSNQLTKTLHYSVRKFLQNQSKQHEITQQFHRTCISHWIVLLFFEFSRSSRKQQSSNGNDQIRTESTLG